MGLDQPMISADTNEPQDMGMVKPFHLCMISMVSFLSKYPASTYNYVVYLLLLIPVPEIVAQCRKHSKVG